MEGRSESMGYFKQRIEDKKVFGVLISDKILQKILFLSLGNPLIAIRLPKITTKGMKFRNP